MLYYSCKPAKPAYRARGSVEEIIVLVIDQALADRIVEVLHSAGFQSVKESGEGFYTEFYSGDPASIFIAYAYGSAATEDLDELAMMEATEQEFPTPTGLANYKAFQQAWPGSQREILKGYTAVLKAAGIHTYCPAQESRPWLVVTDDPAIGLDFDERVLASLTSIPSFTVGAQTVYGHEGLFENEKININHGDPDGRQEVVLIQSNRDAALLKDLVAFLSEEYICQDDFLEKGILVIKPKA